MPKQDWAELDIDAYRKLVAECKDDAEFRRRLQELSGPGKGEKAKPAAGNGS